MIPKFKIYQTHDLGQFFYAIVNAGIAADRQQAAAPGHQLRHRPQALHRHGHEGLHRRAAGAAVGQVVARLRCREEQGLRLRPRQGEVAGGPVRAPNIEFDISWALAGYAAEYEALATIIQGDLAKIGIKTNLKPTDPPTFTQQGTGHEPAVQRHAPERGRLRPVVRSRLGVRAEPHLSATPRTLAASTTTSGRNWPRRGDRAGPGQAQADCTAQINDFLLDASFAMVITAYPDIDLMRPNVMDLKYFLSTATNDRNIWLS